MLSCLLTIAIASALPLNGSVELGTCKVLSDYALGHGMDIHDVPSAGSVSACCSYCANLTQCKAFTYHNGDCFLKYLAEPIAPSTGAVSGVPPGGEMPDPNPSKCFVQPDTNGHVELSCEMGNSIPKNAFDHASCPYIRSISIPPCITSIGDGAFNNSILLESVTFLNSSVSQLSEIGVEAFMYVPKLNNISFPRSLTSIGTRAFFFCTGLVSVNFENSSAVIGQQAFQDCSSITKLNFGTRLQGIGSNAFQFLGPVYNLVFPASLQYIGPYAFFKSQVRSVTLNGTLEQNLFVEERAFANTTALNDFTVLPGVVLDQGVLAYSSVNYLYLSKSNLKSLPQQFCYCCIKLYSVDFPNSLEIIDSEAFAYTADLGSVHLKNVRQVGMNAFLGSRVSSIDFGSELISSIGEGAFQNTALYGNIILPDGLEQIGENAFQGCTSINCFKLGRFLTLVGANAFNVCNGCKYGSFSFCYHPLSFLTFDGGIKGVCHGDSLDPTKSYHDCNEVSKHDCTC
eukprot:m.5912 g.5912  ORF g.5912 m.5912 type:complete len:513 (+) comp3437_c0_seq1:42-1580(+)